MGRYLQFFTPLEPTVHNICQYNFEKQASKIRDLRPDTLAQMMALANIRPGSRVIVVEDVHGMVVSAVAERMGGPSGSHPVFLCLWRLIQRCPQDKVNCSS